MFGSECVAVFQPDAVGPGISAVRSLLDPAADAEQHSPLVEFLVETESFCKVEGDPFKAVEIEDQIRLVSKELSS